MAYFTTLPSDLARPPLSAVTNATPLHQNFAWIALMLALLGSNFSYLLLSWSWSETGRGGVIASPEMMLGFIAMFIALVMVLGASVGTSKWRLFPPLWLSTLFGLILLVGELSRENVGWRNLIMFVSFPAYVLLGRIVGERLVERRFDALHTILVTISTLWMLAFGMFIWTGRISYNELAYTTFQRMDLERALTSTELAIFTGGHFVYLLYAISVVKTIKGQVLVLVMLFVNLVALYFLSPLSALAAYAAVLFFYLIFAQRKPLLQPRVYLAIAVIGGLIALAASQGYFDTMFLSFQYKFDAIQGGSGRSIIYLALIDLAEEYPLFGIGYGRFATMNSFSWEGKGVYPHHNLLGLAAEGGIPASLAYFAFIAVSFSLGVYLLIRLGRLNETRLRFVVFLCVAFLLYHQIRGLVQDTWNVKETFFWIGILASVWDFTHRVKASDSIAGTASLARPAVSIQP